MVRHADVGMTVTEEDIYTHRPLETGGMCAMQGHWGSTALGQEAKIGEKRAGSESIRVFTGRHGQDRVGTVSKFRIGWFKSSR